MRMHMRFGIMICLLLIHKELFQQFFRFERIGLFRFDFGCINAKKSHAWVFVSPFFYGGGGGGDDDGIAIYDSSDSVRLILCWKIFVNL